MEVFLRHWVPKKKVHELAFFRDKDLDPEITIGLVGKYVELQGFSLSIIGDKDWA